MKAARIAATPLPAPFRRRLALLGYVVLPRVADARRLADLRAAFERAARSSDAAQSPAGTPDVRHVERLADKEPAFERLSAERRVLGAALEVIRRPLALFQLNGREPRRGAGHQALHADWLPRRPGEPFSTATALWLLDDYAADNGATRVVPGSHLLFGAPPRASEDRHPDEVVVAAPAGSVLLINGHLWHGGTRNASGARRRMVQCQYVDRELTRPGDVPPQPPPRAASAARRWGAF